MLVFSDACVPCNNLCWCLKYDSFLCDIYDIFFRSQDDNLREAAKVTIKHNLFFSFLKAADF